MPDSGSLNNRRDADGDSLKEYLVKGCIGDSILANDVVLVKIVETLDIEILLQFHIPASRTTRHSAMKELGDAYN